MNVATSARNDSFMTTLNDLGPRQREALDLLDANPAGMTAWEIADKTGRLVHAVRPRLNELAEIGVVAAVGVRFQKRTGRNESVWVRIRAEDNGQRRLFPWLRP